MRMKDAAVATAALASVRWNRRRLAEAVAAARIEGLHANEKLNRAGIVGDSHS
jgi:hypothetical protein